MKSIQNAMLVGVLAASLVMGVIGAYADRTTKQDTDPSAVTQLLTRKVNEYEGQH